MTLSQSQKQKIRQYIPIYKRYFESQEGKDDSINREKRIDLFGNLLSPSEIERMTELELGQVFGSLWASQMWTNKGFFVNKIIQENGWPNIKKYLRHVLWKNEPINNRIDDFRKNIKQIGISMLSEILSFVKPEEFGLWNNITRRSLTLLGFSDSLHFLNKTQLSGAEYLSFLDVLKSIRDEILIQGISTIDLLGLNYFFFVISEEQPNAIEGQENQRPVQNNATHTEIIEQLVSLGLSLGFEAEKEITVARGAKVDVVWRARIANLGVVMYIFEVQCHGAIDSLILNLQRAQVNQSVQRLIVVANENDIERVNGEISSLPESFRRAVSYMKISEVSRAHILMTELFSIINNLNLVKSEFGV